jgi:hypothetical protein
MLKINTMSKMEGWFYIIVEGFPSFPAFEL